MKRQVTFNYSKELERVSLLELCILDLPAI